MSTFRRALVAVGLLALLLGLGVLLLVLRSPQTHATGTFASRGVYACYLLSIGWGFIGTGLYAWARRPGNAVGPLMTAAGFAWLLRGVGVSHDSVLFGIGELAAPIAFALVAHLLLAFPSGRLETRPQRSLALLAYVDVTVLQLMAFAVTDPTSPSSGCPSCPGNPILVTGSPTLSGLVIGVQLLGAVVVLVG